MRIFALVLSFAVLALSSTTALSDVTTSSSSSGGASSAPAVSDPVCDPQLYKRMQQKGWMEAQRETHTNESIILKPPSVFALTCFDRQLQQMKSSYGVLVPEKDGDDAARAVGVVNQSAVGIFRSLIDNKDSLVLSKTNPVENTVEIKTSGDPYKPPITADKDDTGAVAPCNVMRKLWQASKCENVSSTNFATFSELASGKDNRSTTDEFGACPSSKANTDSTSPTDYNMNTINTELKKPGAGLSSKSNPDGKFDEIDPEQKCSTLTWSELKDAGCPQKCYPKIAGDVVVGCTFGCTINENRDGCDPPSDI